MSAIQIKDLITEIIADCGVCGYKDIMKHNDLR
jgi:hypothetical protein